MLDSSIMRVLIVDDEVRVCEWIEQVVGSAAFQSVSAYGPVEALNILQTEVFDLVVCDIRMGEVDGVELVREIRRSCPFTDCIVMTAHPESYTYQDIIDAGASDFIHKPFTAEELHAKMNRIKRERWMRRSLEEANRALERESNVNASLASLARSVLSSSSLDDCSKLALDVAKELTQSRLGYAGIIDSKTGFLVCPTMTEDIWEQCTIPKEDFVFKDFHGLWGWVLRNRLPLLCNNPKLDARSTGTPPGHMEIRNFMSVPVLFGQDLVGQISLANKTGEYDEQDLTLLERVANIYAVAIEQGRYREEIDQYEFHLEELVEERTSDLIKANRQLQESEKKARDLTENVLQMLMIMSHDIRGPLVSMGAILKLLLRGTYGKMDESVKNTTRELMSRTTNLIRIAEDCLRKAHNVGNKGDAEIEVLDLRQDVIDVVLDELADDIVKANITIDHSLGGIPAGQILVKGSKVWLKAVYRNLFGNAIKHGGAGCTIAFGFEDRGSHYRLNVYNTGKTIPEEERGKLFTRFGRIESSGGRTVDGMGVGLYLIREKLRNLGGDIWYEAKDDGSDFVFTIPHRSFHVCQEME